MDDDEQIGPNPVSDKWPSLPGDIDGVLSNQNALYFFKDQGFYRFIKESNDTFKVILTTSRQLVGTRL